MTNHSYLERVVLPIYSAADNLSEIHEYGNSAESDYPLLRVSASSKSSNPWILMSAGADGTETAAVLALARFIEEQLPKYLDQFSFLIYPCLHPSGFAQGRQYANDNDEMSRIHRANICSFMDSVNSTSTQFIAALSLGEYLQADETGEAEKENHPNGYYCLPSSSSATQLGIGWSMSRAVRFAGYRVRPRGAGHKSSAKCGFVSYEMRGDAPKSTASDFFSDSVFTRVSDNHLSSFTPLDWTLGARIWAHLAAIRGALEAAKCLSLVSQTTTSAAAPFDTGHRVRLVA